MKKGEIVGLAAAGLLLVGFAALTVYYESKSQRLLPQQRFAGMPEGQRVAAGAGEANRAIPRGILLQHLPDPQSHGAGTLETYCNQCHDLPTPTMHTAQEWEAVLQRMNSHIQSRRGGMLSRVAMPAERDWATLRTYLTQYALRPLVPAGLNDLNTPAGRAFQSTCSQCHAAPDPTQHKAKTWARLVLRMKDNMRESGKPVPDDPTSELIVGYLQLHASTDVTVK